MFQPYETYQPCQTHTEDTSRLEMNKIYDMKYIQWLIGPRKLMIPLHIAQKKYNYYNRDYI